MNILEQKPCGWYGPQNLSPKHQHLIRDLRKVVKTPEYDRIVRRALQILIRLKTFRRREAEMRLRQTKDAFHKQPVHLRRIDKGITENVVHRRQPRRIEVPNARDLHRCRLICRDLQRLAACRMPRKIKEDIRRIRIDTLCRFLRRIFRQIGIAIRHPGHPVRHLRMLSANIVETYLKTRTIIGREELYRKVQHNMIREIRREVADPEFFPLPLPVGELRQRSKHVRIRRMYRTHFLSRHPLDIVEVHEIIAQCRQPCRMICTRVFPCLAQIRQCFSQIGKPVEQLPHELIQFIASIHREQRFLLHFLQKLKSLL